MEMLRHEVLRQRILAPGRLAVAAVVNGDANGTKTCAESSRWKETYHQVFLFFYFFFPQLIGPIGRTRRGLRRKRTAICQQLAAYRQDPKSLLSPKGISLHFHVLTMQYMCRLDLSMESALFSTGLGQARRF